MTRAVWSAARRSAYVYYIGWRGSMLSANTMRNRLLCLDIGYLTASLSLKTGHDEYQDNCNDCDNDRNDAKREKPDPEEGHEEASGPWGFCSAVFRIQAEFFHGARVIMVQA
jgi:hypothetical protein